MDISNSTAPQNRKPPYRVFISYKHTDPDQCVATEVFEALQDYHDVFIDQTMLVGFQWAETIEMELRRTDFLIPFLSAASVESEMVRAEIETAHHLYKEFGRPIILPVRVAYYEPFQYPLSAYLNPINWAHWDSNSDTTNLIEILLEAIAGQAPLQSPLDQQAIVLQATSSLPAPTPVAQLSTKIAPPQVRLELPEGTIRLDSQFYVRRQSDDHAHSALREQVPIITIKGPRQMGKSSLLMRLIDAASDDGKRVAYLDFQLFERTVLRDANTFFRQFSAWLTSALDLDIQIDEHWDARLGNLLSCTQYVEQQILDNMDAPVVFALDEVESVFDMPYRADFFGMLRYWYNIRAREQKWNMLTCVLVTATDPHLFIPDLHQSPFNVGEIINLEDLTYEQVVDLNHRHGSPLNLTEIKELCDLVGGQPYLVRKALYLVASGRTSMADLIASASDEHGPFGDHLRYHLFRLQGNQDLIEGLWDVLRDKRRIDEALVVRLRGAGLIRTRGKEVFPRCELYARFFEGYL